MFKQTLQFFELLAASNRTANALQNHRKPRAEDLKRMGLEADRFDMHFPS